MPDQSFPRPSFSRYRRWRIGLQVGFLVLVVFAVVVMANYLSRDYFGRFHLNSRSSVALSHRTVRFLESLTNRVKVVVYFDKADPMYSLVSDLLKEYKAANPKISVQVVDSIRDADAAIKLKDKYKFLNAPNAKNFVIFDCDNNVKGIDATLLAQYVLEPVPDEKEPSYRKKPVLFQGEVAFTSALIAVTNPKRQKACFLQDDGEHPFDSTDENLRYATFASVLRENYIDVEPLSLLSTNPIPADCTLLVIAGPQRPMPEIVLTKIEQYLNQGGRLLALFDFRSAQTEIGLEPILAKWGVLVSTNVIKDFENTTQTKEAIDMIVGSFGKHPIVNPLLADRLQLILPRPIGPLPGQSRTPEAPRIDVLAFSGSNSIAADNPAFGPHAFPLMVALEKGAIKDISADRGTTRMVVIGDSFFLADRQIESAANKDFAQLLANWLVDRPQLLKGLGPRPVAEYRIAMTRPQQRGAEWLLLGAMPGGILAFGSLVWLRRRR